MIVAWLHNSFAMMDSSPEKDLSYRTTIAIAFAIPICAIALALRLLARRMQNANIGADDCMIIVAVLFAIGNAVRFVFTNNYGNGKHLFRLSQHDLTAYCEIL